MGTDLGVKQRDAKRMHGTGPFVSTQVTKGVGLDEVVEHLLGTWRQRTGARVS